MRPRGRRGGCRQSVSSGRVARVGRESGGVGFGCSSGSRRVGLARKERLLPSFKVPLMPPLEMPPLGLAGVGRRLRVRPWCRGPVFMPGSALAVLGSIKGGGLYLQYSNATIADSDVYGNTAVRSRLPDT